MQQPAREAREDAAARWATRLARPEPLSPEDHVLLDAWYAAHPANRAALARYQALWSDPAFAAALERPRHLRRRLIAGGALAAGLATAAWLGRAPIGRALADVATAPGEIRALAPLPGGGRLTLDTATAVDLGAEGVLHLRAGALRLAVPVDARPVPVQGTRMTVLAGSGCVMVLRASAEAEHLAVLEGGATASTSAATRLVEAGEGLVCDAAGLGPVRPLPPAERVRAEGFGEGWRRFDGETVAQVAAEVARYLPWPLMVAEEVAGLRVTGRFRLADPRAALAALEAGLPLRVRRYGPVLRLEGKI